MLVWLSVLHSTPNRLFIKHSQNDNTVSESSVKQSKSYDKLVRNSSPIPNAIFTDTVTFCYRQCQTWSDLPFAIGPASFLVAAQINSKWPHLNGNLCIFESVFKVKWQEMIYWGKIKWSQPCCSDHSTKKGAFCPFSKFVEAWLDLLY